MEPVKERKTRSLRRTLTALSVLAAVGGMLYLVNPTAGWWVPKCPFRLLTGLSCPACGLQRFVHALLHGRVGEALRYNYYLVFSLPYAMLFAVAWAMPDCNWRTRLKNAIEDSRVLWFYVITFVVWLVVRNILGI